MHFDATGKNARPLGHAAIVSEWCGQQSPSPDRWIFESRLRDVGVCLKTGLQILCRPRRLGLREGGHRLAGRSEKLPVRLEWGLGTGPQTRFFHDQRYHSAWMLLVYGNPLLPSKPPPSGTEPARVGAPLFRPIRSSQSIRPPLIRIDQPACRHGCSARSSPVLAVPFRIALTEPGMPQGTPDWPGLPYWPRSLRQPPGVPPSR